MVSAAGDGAASCAPRSQPPLASSPHTTRAPALRRRFVAMCGFIAWSPRALRWTTTCRRAPRPGPREQASESALSFQPSGPWIALLLLGVLHDDVGHAAALVLAAVVGGRLQIWYAKPFAMPVVQFGEGVFTVAPTTIAVATVAATTPATTRPTAILRGDGAGRLSVLTGTRPRGDRRGQRQGMDATAQRASA